VSIILGCPKCGENAELPETTPQFGTSLTCRKCHASLMPVYEPELGSPVSVEPSEVVAFLGYHDCSLDHPRCPWCQKINYSVVFPEAGYRISWYANREQENPRANFVIGVQCVHCGQRFVVEWDVWPFDSTLRCNFCSKVGGRDIQFMTIPESRRSIFERALGRTFATQAHQRDNRGDPLWVVCPDCLKAAKTNL
jgi:hypothetical protein